MTVVAAALLLGGCASKWVCAQDAPGDYATTRVKVTTDPPGGDVSVNGNRLGKAPFVVPIRYPYQLKVYERRNFWPYPHREEKETRYYFQNGYTFQAFLVGHSMAQRELRLFGEEEVEVELTLHPVR